MYYEHQPAVYDKEIEKGQPGIGIQQIQKIQDHGRPREHKRIVADDLYQLMQRPSQKHIPVHIAQQVHGQKNRQTGHKEHTEIHTLIVAAEQTAAPDIIGKNQADRNADTVQRHDDQTLQS